MTVKLAVIMDPITTIDFEKDGTLALLLAAQARGWELYYLEQQDLFLKNTIPQGHAAKITVYQDPQRWFELAARQAMPLRDFDVILMRKDPPVDEEYIFTTYLLDAAEQQGVLVVNKPQSLRDFNEKFMTQWFPQCCPETLITSDQELILQFLQQHQRIVLKPLTEMAGKSVFCLQAGDVNTRVIIETLTHQQTRKIMVQRFISEIFTQGDKRIFLVEGEPMPYALVRTPTGGDFRGNIAAGGVGSGGTLTERDLWLCQQIGPALQRAGLLLVGLDVIGDYVTEINITSPTGVRQIKTYFDFDIPERVITCIANKLTTSHGQHRGSSSR